MRTTRTLIALAAFSCLAGAQSNTSTLDGTITDAQGAAVPRADVTITISNTGQKVQTRSDDHGHWAVPSLYTGTYAVTINAAGFKTSDKSGVKLDAEHSRHSQHRPRNRALPAKPSRSPAGLKWWKVHPPTVSERDLTGRQVSDLPIPSRNAHRSHRHAPRHVQTPAGPSQHHLHDGLPQATVNMTLDGVNIQDNINKNGSGGAFYPLVYPRTDAIEEVSVTNAASGVENLGEGEIQVKFVTKSGTNTWHGSGAFWRRSAIRSSTPIPTSITSMACRATASFSTKSARTSADPS